MVAGSRKKLSKFSLFEVFGEKQPLTEKFSKFCSDTIHRDTDRRVVFKFHEIWPTVNG